jgi:hypothetical protein
MKRALQAILIAPNSKMRLDILQELKQVTIREGHRDYTCGPAMICCHIDPWAVMVDITSVRHTVLNDLEKDELKEDGFTDHQHALESLKSFYPNLTEDSEVTVVRWDNVRGFLVDQEKWASGE